MANGINRRRLLTGGGAGIGLIVAWGLWPRDYAPTLVANPGETLFGAWLKIGQDGHVTVAVPQAEHGQGAYTALAQIVADELGVPLQQVRMSATRTGSRRRPAPQAKPASWFCSMPRRRDSSLRMRELPAVSGASLTAGTASSP